MYQKEQQKAHIKNSQSIGILLACGAFLLFLLFLVISTSSSIIFLLLLILLFIAWLMLHSYYKKTIEAKREWLEQYGTRVVAKVVSRDEGSSDEQTTRSIHLDWSNPQTGRVHSFSRQISSGRAYSVGDPIPVIFDPDDESFYIVDLDEDS